MKKANIPSNVVNFYHLYFTGIGGAKVHAQLVIPKKIHGFHPGMLMFHGYHCSAGDFEDKIGWAAEGFIVLALDCRGQGGLSEDNQAYHGDILNGLIIRGIENWNPVKLYFYREFLDTYQATKILMKMEHVDKNRIFVHGVSQGGGLAIACAGLVPEIYKVQVAYPFLSDYRKAYLYGSSTAFSELSYWFHYRDPLHKKETEFFNMLDYIDIKFFADNIKAQVLWEMGGSDTQVPPETQMAAYNRINSKKQIYLAPEYGHEFIPRIGDNIRKFFIHPM
ncbi:alpha/beta fold hydrolase [Lactobacillus hamsteri]|uniref:Cephalosporin-C deacetylase n=1 Tax=Lactobacillus hamsteri DSM 5661 = JCM 6256 TaxID=1423754 RepID=A0A0R1YDZ2_9LACO|nr:cephalosporin-C deacetylase [Lactobacillus hamsteri DSM 5661 = JCM 6256]